MTEGQRQAVLAFAQEADHFEARVTGGVRLDLEELYSLLVRLQYAALSLPDVEPGRDEPEADSKESNMDRRSQVSPAVPSLGFYHHVLNPNDVPSAPEVALGDAVDDLADIISELRTGRALLQQGDIHTAAWTWRWAFWNHWRAHAVGLMTALNDELL